jgi:hypothetical protein
MSDQNGNSTADTNDDLSGLTGFFFYMFIVHPITAWILKPGRFERQKSIYYAIIFLAGLAAVKTGTYILERGVLVSRVWKHPCYRHRHLYTLQLMSFPTIFFNKRSYRSTRHGNESTRIELLCYVERITYIESIGNQTCV